MTTFRLFARTAMAAPLALALAACGSGGEGGDAALSGDPIAPIAAPEGTSWTEQVTVTEADGYLIGNPDAPLKLIEYASHTCGACAQFSQTGMPPLKEEYISKGIVSVELRNLVRDPLDLVIAMMVRCGDAQNVHPLAEAAWADFNTTVATPMQSAGGAIEQAISQPEDQRYIAIAQAAGLIDYFAARGISADQAQACLADPEKAKQIAQNSADQAREMGVTSTPTFFLNGNLVDANQWPGLEPILQEAGAREE